MVPKVEVCVPQIRLHLLDLIISGSSRGLIVLIRFDRGHLRSSNCLILEEVSRCHRVRVINLDVSLLR